MSPSVLEELSALSRSVEAQYRAERRLLSFEEYLQLFEQDPVRHSRDASRYLRDAFEHYGTRWVERPWGRVQRWCLFDLPFLPSAEARREALVGQEEVQAGIVQALRSFAQEGRPHRVVLLHGPNGSAKSTALGCVQRALEHYSSLDEGALYRFHWVFPSTSQLRGAIGFGEEPPALGGGSYAHLPEDRLDARLQLEVRDHPLFLLPEAWRREWLARHYERVGSTEPPSRWLLEGGPSHKCRQVLEALLGVYRGSLREVWRHVQVERYFISRRYRIGAVTLGPSLSVDAAERQVTLDRSLSALPPSLQSLSMFELHGELIDAAGGMIEYSDLLKRPVEHFKYLQLTAETGEVTLPSQSVQLNCVLFASANELHLAAFREHPEFESFRGRLSLLRAPYLRRWTEEAQIYAAQVGARLSVPVAPHALELCAKFAVLTRLHPPRPERHPAELRPLLEQLTALDKLELYTHGEAPRRWDAEAAKLMRAALPALYAEYDADVVYEGSLGASPREMTAVLVTAAQAPRYGRLSPLGVLEALEALCRRSSDYAWLGLEPLPGGYHDPSAFRAALREQLLDTYEEELLHASRLVDEDSYVELFGRYVSHVSHWVKGERWLDPVTGQYQPPDEALMQEIEARLGLPDEPRQQRHELITRAAAWAIEHPGLPVDPQQVFAAPLRRLKDAMVSEKRQALGRLTHDLLTLTQDGGAGLDEERRALAQRLLAELQQRYGYDEGSAVEAATLLLRERFGAP